MDKTKFWREQSKTFFQMNQICKHTKRVEENRRNHGKIAISLSDKEAQEILRSQKFRNIHCDIPGHAHASLPLAWNTPLLELRPENSVKRLKPISDFSTYNPTDSIENGFHVCPLHSCWDKRFVCFQNEHARKKHEKFWSETSRSTVLFNYNHIIFIE